MRASGKPKVRKTPGPMSRKGEFLAIGDRVDPNRTSAEETPDRDAEKAWCGARRNHDIRPLPDHNAKDGEGAAQQCPFVPPIRIGNDVEALVANVCSIAFLDRRVNDVGTLECGA